MTIGNRVRTIRKTLGLNQTQFAEKIGITQRTLSGIEKEAVNLTERNAKEICRVFHVNNAWLQTGEGEMLVEPSEDEQLAQFVGEVLAGRPDDLRRAFLVAMAQLDENGWKFLAGFARTVYEEGRLDKEKESPIICQ